MDPLYNLLRTPPIQPGRAMAMELYPNRQFGLIDNPDRQSGSGWVLTRTRTRSDGPDPSLTLTTGHHSRFREKWPAAMLAPFGGWVCRLLQLLLLQLCVIGFDMCNLTGQCLSLIINHGVKSAKNGIYLSNQVLQRLMEYCQGCIIKDIFILVSILVCLQWPLKQLT